MGVLEVMRLHIGKRHSHCQLTAAVRGVRVPMAGDCGAAVRDN